MKKSFLIILIVLLSLHITGYGYAEVETRQYDNLTWYYITPGLYTVGEDLPGGTYDVRIESGNGPCDIACSAFLTDEGVPDLSYYYAYMISYYSEHWPQGAHPVISVLQNDYLLIKGRSCRFYPVSMGY